MEREQVDELLDELLRHEMPRHVEHGAAPREARCIVDRHRRHFPSDVVGSGFAENLGRQQLAQRLDAVENPGRRRTANRDPRRRDVEMIALRSGGSD